MTKTKNRKAKETTPRECDAGAPSPEMRGLRISDFIEELLSQPPFIDSFTTAELQRIIASFRKRRSNNQLLTAR